MLHFNSHIISFCSFSESFHMQNDKPLGHFSRLHRDVSHRLAGQSPGHVHVRKETQWQTQSEWHPSLQPDGVRLGLPLLSALQDVWSCRRNALVLIQEPVLDRILLLFHHDLHQLPVAHGHSRGSLFRTGLSVQIQSHAKASLRLGWQRLHLAVQRRSLHHRILHRPHARAEPQWTQNRLLWELHR